MTIIVIVLIIIMLYLLAIMPNMNKSRKEQMASFEDVYLTHRGLFNNQDIPENSTKAFKETVKGGYGTELDVQLTLDNKLVVFHDASLLRMCGVDKKLTDCNYDDLQQYKLLNTQETIPLFSEVLDLLKEDTPLVVEIKSEGDCIKTCEEAIKMLQTYKRNFTMESFNPKVVRYLKKKHPEIIRGQLAYNMLIDKKSKTNILIKFVCTNLLLNFITKPDYVAYDIKNMNNLSFRLVSKLYKVECVAWTCKCEDDIDKAKRYYQQFIFDSFVPRRDIKVIH